MTLVFLYDVYKSLQDRTVSNQLFAPEVVQNQAYLAYRQVLISVILAGSETNTASRSLRLLPAALSWVRGILPAHIFINQVLLAVQVPCKSRMFPCPSPGTENLIGRMRIIRAASPYPSWFGESSPLLSLNQIPFANQSGSSAQSDSV